MAEFLLMPFGSAGDTFPFIGMGRRLLERGHQVSVVANGYFAKALADAGLHHHELGTEQEFVESIKDPNIWHPRKGFEAVVGHPRMPEIVERQHALVVEAYQRNPELVVVAGSIAFGARVARETHGVRLVTVHLSPIAFLSVEQPPATAQLTVPAWWPRSWVRAMYWLGNKLVINPVMHRTVGAFRQELGLPRVRRYFQEWIHSPELVLALFPRWFAEPAADWPPQVELTNFPLHDVGGDEHLAPDVWQYLKDGMPPVVMTFGSAMTVGQRLFTATIEACQRLGRRAMVLTRFPDQLPRPLPKDVRLFDYVPLSSLLPHAAALVHHGGIGTTAQGLCAGVPQLTTPLAHDQMDNAARVKRIGAGESLPATQVTTRRMARLLDALLHSPEYRASAEAAAGRLREADGLEQTCSRLERFANAPRPKPCHSKAGL